MEKDTQANTNSLQKKKKGGLVILISNKIDIKTKLTKIKRNITYIKGSIHQEDRTILNVYTSNYRASKHMKKKLTNSKEKQTKPE